MEDLKEWVERGKWEDGWEKKWCIRKSWKGRRERKDAGDEGEKKRR